MKIESRYSVQARGQPFNACANQLGQDAGRARETGLLTDDIANGSSNTCAVERWHMLAVALIVG
jgi:hypothetical protein